MLDREIKILQIQAEIDLMNYIGDYVETYKYYDIKYHTEKLEDNNIDEYEREYHEKELKHITIQKEHIKNFISKL